MLKVLGALLILAGSGVICVRKVGGNRKQLTGLRQWIASLELMESEIRWKNTPLPDILHSLTGQMLIGPVIQEICRRKDCPLQEAWTVGTQKVQPPEASEILGHLKLTGDEERLLSSLHYASEQLKRLLTEKKKSQRDSEKLCLAVSFSGAGLLVILLL